MNLPFPPTSNLPNNEQTLNEHKTGWPHTTIMNRLSTYTRRVGLVQQQCISTGAVPWQIASSSRFCGDAIFKRRRRDVENVQYATNHKRKGGGSARAVRSARSASHLEPGLFLAISLSGIDFVVVQHLIRCLYHKLEKRQQPIVRLIGRSTSLVFGIVSLDFLAVQVSVQFCIQSSSSRSSSWWLIVVRLACRQFSGSGEALGGSDGLCVLSTVTMLHESHPPRWMQLDAKSVGQR